MSENTQDNADCGEHVTGIRYSRGHAEYVPDCRCGWTGSYALTRTSAEREAAKHVSDECPTTPGYLCEPCRKGEHWRCSEPGTCQCTEPVDAPRDCNGQALGSSCKCGPGECPTTPGDPEPPFCTVCRKEILYGSRCHDHPATRDTTPAEADGDAWADDGGYGSDSVTSPGDIAGGEGK